MEDEYEVIVAGAGHAGCEAALAAARSGVRTLVFCTQLDSIAFMACNPAVGGPGKSHLVREIEALGGEMGRAADNATINRRVLNRSKGPAVRALRAQVDKALYQRHMRWALEREPKLTIRQGRVDKVCLAEGRVTGVETQSGQTYGCRAVIVATGVYLEARVFMGELEEAGGPNGLKPARGLSRNLGAMGMTWKRFRTTTPPRVSGKTLSLQGMEEQKGEDVPGFSRREGREGEGISPLSCWMTRTNSCTHRIIAGGCDRSFFQQHPLQGGEPRYCPSIEDKVVRFAHRESHQIFLEPEGWDTDEYYVMGMFTSLPEDVQVAALRTMSGLEKVEMLRPGYGIEYDVIDPMQLDPGLQAKGFDGLYFAGQVNGTSGYEEAAGQGMLAGINASRQLQGQEPLILDRSQAYLGVMVDDLVTKGVAEPYRILTSRAEYRLLLRPENAELRLRSIGGDMGLIPPELVKEVEEMEEKIESVKDGLNSRIVHPGPGINGLLQGRGETLLDEPARARDLLRRPSVHLADLEKLGLVKELAPGIREVIEIEVKYEGYIERQRQQVQRFRNLEHWRIPEDVNYNEMFGLSREACDRLKAVKPRSLGQASRVSGVTPADISIVMVALERMRQGRDAHAGPGAVDLCPEN